ncbi:metallophosphoesterase family protein [Thermodesulforhabdus norvegica]|uniref:Serine/threonine protein phosphatase 1 n=1 Tax=Thermodesulforhabdus norvegica TaxID=39841 RepID=A0A1I4T5C4_9BACT|nr:metallophosphoesterase family protein [Thermodesulforhabdus norvegica]SFM71958.1 serine/threonine protein phosphatase 1 [Thermodesulforhabdus norvegica]
MKVCDLRGQSFRSIYAVGDIHGMAPLLEELLDLVTFDPDKDLMIFLGDYIDRGPYSREVIEILLGLVNRYPSVLCLKGNHEQMFLDFLSGADPLVYFWNGGRQTLKSYGYRERDDGSYEVFVPEEHLKFLRSLHLGVETDDYIFVHAGLRPGIPLDLQSEEDMLWIRHEFIYSMEDFGKRVVFGHTPVVEPLVMHNKIGIDTGAVYGRYLTCVKLPDEEFYRVW